MTYYDVLRRTTAYYDVLQRTTPYVAAGCRWQIKNLVNPDGRPPAGPGPEIGDSFGARPGRGELPQASVNPGALQRGTVRRPGRWPPDMRP
eukprot:3715502-Alexandrium_andersonii.AAC.1